MVTWGKSKVFLRNCNPSEVNKSVLYSHYENYINNRPREDKFPIGNKSNSPKNGSALRFCVEGRSLILAIHNNSCAVCGDSHSDRHRLQFHHVEPLCETHNNDITNIIPVCAGCHADLHRVLSVYGNAVNNMRIRA